MRTPRLPGKSALAWLLLSLAPSLGATGHTITASFSCDGGRNIQALFTQGTQPAVKLTLQDGRQLTLPQVLSGSGARYANADESIVFWNKGRTAFLEEAGKRTYSSCEQLPLGPTPRSRTQPGA
jgi:membrane-bound inhibitor of C-type lysozyme